MLASAAPEKIHARNQPKAGVADDTLYLYDLIFDKVPSVNNFEINDRLTVVEFANLLSSMEIDKFCNVLNYLKKIKLIKIKEVDRFLNFFHINSRISL